MAAPNQPEFRIHHSDDYRENYANSIQVRVSVWDFCLLFGMIKGQSEQAMEVENFQGVYLSPQQAKALYKILEQNILNYEQAFGEIKLDPKMTGSPVH